MAEGTSPGRPEVAAARDAVLASRASLGEEIVRLEASARAAVDIKAKVKRNPVKTVGLVAGAGFMVIGGPKRVIRRAKRAVFGPEAPLPTSMLPKEIDAALGRLGTDGEMVRGTIEREFAAYLAAQTETGRRRDTTAVLMSILADTGRGFAIRYGRRLAGQLASTDAQTYRERLEKVRAARTGSARGGSAG